MLNRLEECLKLGAFAQLHCGRSLKFHMFRKMLSSQEVETVTWIYRHRLQKILIRAIKSIV
jgi:hypothetical protein